MLTLGIETSARAGSIAIVDDGQLLAVNHPSAAGRRHARTLVPEIGNLVREAGRSLHDLQGIAVGLGPGSFTGLRVGVVCAKTLAYALGCPIVGVDTFLAVAQSLPHIYEECWVIDDALRGDVYRGRYVRQGDAWTCKSPPGLAGAFPWLAELPETAIVAGPAVEKVRRDAESTIKCSCLPVEPSASEIAWIGERRLISGNVDDVWTLEPTYIRRSAAEEKAENSSVSP